MPAGDAVDAGIKTRQKSTYIDISRAGKDEVWEWIEVASGYLAEQKTADADFGLSPPTTGLLANT